MDSDLQADPDVPTTSEEGPNSLRHTLPVLGEGIDLPINPEVAETSEETLGSDQPALPVPGEGTSLQVGPEVAETSDESSEIREGSESVEPALPTPEADQPPAGDLRAGLALLARTRTLELLAALGAEDTPVRYRTLATQLGTTMLATRLRELTAAGLVLRHVDTGPPIEVSYTLSPTAAPLTGPVRELLAWAGTYTPPGQAPHQPEPGDEESLSTA